MNKQITYEDILLINKLCLLSQEPFGVVNENRIRSALGNQFQPYSTCEQAFASVYKSLVINHGFMNGNKRTGVITLYLASRMLNNNLKADDKELCDLTYKIAGENGSKISVEEIANQVFDKQGISNSPTKDFDVEEVTLDFIKNHKWLIEELAK